MRNLKLFTSVIIAIILVVGLTHIVMAADNESAQVPEPYSGMTNPFSWDDSASQDEGKQLYASSCAGCHGISGSNLPSAKFDAEGFSSKLEQNPDFYFWVVSDGRLMKGMPPYKSSLTEEQRWKILNFIWTLSPVSPAKEETPVPTVTATTTLTISPNGTATATPVVTPTVKPTETAIAIPTIAPTITATATPTATPTVEPTPTTKPPVDVPGKAHADAPDPYGGLTNPFDWADADAEKAGERVYTGSCIGCHGPSGSNVPSADFSAAEFPVDIESSADFYYWVLSEGRLTSGMPPYKSSLSEKQRWQVLTYLGSFASDDKTTNGGSGTVEGPTASEAKLVLTGSGDGDIGVPMTFSAMLEDKDGDPLSNSRVIFFIQSKFFVEGMAEIGAVLTDSKGEGIFEYIPRQPGNRQVVARYEDVESSKMVNIADTGEVFYEAEVGLHLPSPGKEVFIGPESAKSIGEMGEAPTSGIRLPGGIISWILFLLIVIAFIWATYFRVVFQIFRIPILSEISDTNTRLVPMIGLAVVAVLGLVLFIMVLTGPYSHFHVNP